MFDCQDCITSLIGIDKTVFIDHFGIAYSYRYYVIVLISVLE